MERVRKQVEADRDRREAWEKRPVTAAVLDTGIGYHPDLANRLLCFRDFVNQRTSAYDDNGHGTHICGILCGSGLLSGGRYAGMAPGCRLVMGKVLDEKGDGLTRHMLEGLEWVLENQQQYGIRILNISVGIGSLQDRKKEEELQKMIEKIWDSGIIVVCAAGNKGPADNSISSVCNSERIVTVGCHDGAYAKEDPGRCEIYSGRGPYAAVVRKPDIVAPGTAIVSCDVQIRRQYHRYFHAYTAKSGTSMATPVVSGALALLLQKYPRLSPGEAKWRLTYTATDLGAPWNQQGWGMVNVHKLLADL